MRYLWRRLTGRCPCCGQQLNGHQTVSERIEQINNRAGRLAAELGRSPRAQNCESCGRLIFEGELGFVQRYLLVDILDWEPTPDVCVGERESKQIPLLQPRTPHQNAPVATFSVASSEKTLCNAAL